MSTVAESILFSIAIAQLHKFGLAPMPRRWLTAFGDHCQGTNGSGTIFFGGCNLKCVFCQNWDVSQTKGGWALPADELADMMLKLQDETSVQAERLII
jgi:pyruvate-formate lyase-activating enzyme